MAIEPLYYEYAAQPGDTLLSIIHRFYGASPPMIHYGEQRRFLLQLNPHIDNPDRLWPGTIVRLADCRTFAPSVGRHFVSAIPDAVHRQQFWVMAWAEHGGLLAGAGGVATGAASNLLNAGNTQLLRQIGDEYAEYRAGRMTKGQYDHRRRVLIGQFRQNVGPVERWLFRGLPTPQAIRIARGGGVPYDHRIQHHTGRLMKMGRLAGRGGIVLGGVGITMACAQIAQTMDRREKNEILVDTIASTLVGSGFGVAVGAFLISNPVGWGTAVVLALAGAAASFGGGQLARYVYNQKGGQVDFVNGLGLEGICR